MAFNPGMTIQSDIASAREATPTPSNVVKLPSALTESASKAPKVSTPTPVYQGPSINSVPHVANQLGLSYKYDPMTSTHSVNGIPVTVTSTSSGMPQAPVSMIATAGGYPATHVQKNPDGSTTVMPDNTKSAQTQPVASALNTFRDAGTGYVPPSTQPSYTPPTPQPAPVPAAATGLRDAGTGYNPASAPMPTPAPIPAPPITPAATGLRDAGTGYQPPALSNTASGTNTPDASPNASSGPTGASTGTSNGPFNPYWQGVQANKGLWQTNTGNLPQSQWLAQLAQQYGVPQGVIQVNSAGHAFIPWQYLANYAAAQSQSRNALGAPINSNTGNPAFDQIISLLTQMMSGYQNPYTSQIASLQQPTYSFDPNAAMQQAYQMENPIYQQQILAADQKINDDMNKRGIYNSGLAQQAVDSQNAALYQNLDNAAMKDFNTLQTNSLDQYKANLQAYADQVTALHDAGQMSDTQFSQEMSNLNTLLSRVTSQQNADTTATNDATKNSIAEGNLLVNQGKLSIEQFNSANSALNKLGLGIDPTTGKLVQTLQGNNQAFTQQLDLSKLSVSQLTAINNALKTVGLGINPLTGQTETSEQAANDQRNFQLKQDNQTFQQSLATAKLNLSQQQLAEKAWQAMLPYTSMTADQKATIAIDYAKLDLQQQTLTDSMIKAELPYQNLTAYQKAEITLKQSAQSFQQNLDTIKVEQAGQKIKDAEGSQAFKEWLSKQQNSLAYDKFNQTQKVNTINEWVKQESTALSQLKAAQTTAEGELSNVTKQLDTMQNSINFNAADPNYQALQSKATGLINTLNSLAQQLGSIGTANLNNANSNAP